MASILGSTQSGSLLSNIAAAQYWGGDTMQQSYYVMPSYVAYSNIGTTITVTQPDPVCIKPPKKRKWQDRPGAYRDALRGEIDEWHGDILN